MNNVADESATQQFIYLLCMHCKVLPELILYLRLSWTRLCGHKKISVNHGPLIIEFDYYNLRRSTI